VKFKKLIVRSPQSTETESTVLFINNNSTTTTTTTTTTTKTDRRVEKIKKISLRSEAIIVLYLYHVVSRMANANSNDINLPDPHLLQGIKTRMDPHLLEEIKNGRCVAFLGAGFSVPSGLPTWANMTKKAILRFHHANCWFVLLDGEDENTAPDNLWLDKANDAKEDVFADFVSGKEVVPPRWYRLSEDEALTKTRRWL
jgi:hypothetical protein